RIVMTSNDAMLALIHRFRGPAAALAFAIAAACTSGDESAGEPGAGGGGKDASADRASDGPGGMQDARKDTSADGLGKNGDGAPGGAGEAGTGGAGGAGGSGGAGGAAGSAGAGGTPVVFPDHRVGYVDSRNFSISYYDGDAQPNLGWEITPLVIGQTGEYQAIF